MRLPRDLSGDELASLLRRYGYEVMRQTGSHMRLTSSAMEPEHHVTVPRHRALRVGTLSGIVTEVASYLDIDRDDLVQELFGTQAEAAGQSAAWEDQWDWPQPAVPQPAAPPHDW